MLLPMDPLRLLLILRPLIDLPLMKLPDALDVDKAQLGPVLVQRVPYWLVLTDPRHCETKDCPQGLERRGRCEVGLTALVVSL